METYKKFWIIFEAISVTKLFLCVIMKRILKGYLVSKNVYKAINAIFLWNCCDH